MRCSKFVRVCFSLAILTAVAGMSVTAQVFEQAPVAQAPVAQAPLPAVVGGYEYYAANLGIWYRLVPYGNPVGGYTTDQGNYNPYNPPGSYPQGPIRYGVRLSRYPVAGSACAFLQLEPGDMIISLDGLPIYGPNDVLGHYGNTNMIFINIRTGYPQPANINLPG